jgi:hypothetical protein
MHANGDAACCAQAICGDNSVYVNVVSLFMSPYAVYYEMSLQRTRVCQTDATQVMIQAAAHGLIG